MSNVLQEVFLTTNCHFYGKMLTILKGLDKKNVRKKCNLLHRDVTAKNCMELLY